jgi:UDP-N-acetylmuramoylalanine--D-glutamate ligase
VSVVTGRRALVVGLGRSGEAAARALRACGADVSVVDGADTPAAGERAEQLVGVSVRLGADLDDPSALDGVDLVVASPGVPPARGVLCAAVARDLPVWSEVELAWRLASGRTRLVAVTGTNGKTSTTELLAACLDAPSAGNIGTPLVALLGLAHPPPLVVVELSSFQLHFTSDLRPDVAVLLNVAPDHLDWHGDTTAYADAKARIWANQGRCDLVVVDGHDPGAQAVVARTPPPGRVVRVGSPPVTTPLEAGAVGVADGALSVGGAAGSRAIVALADLHLGGPHQLANACAAVTAALAAGASVDACATALRAFRPGPHRLEHVADIGGVAYVNDSKATNPHAAAAALAAHTDVVLIAGGLAKGLDLSVLAPALRDRARAVVTIGTSGPLLAELARDLGLPVEQAGTLERAVPAAARLARPGWTVLLAPACASMDQFADYAARGQVFRDAVAALVADARPSPPPRPAGAPHDR